jgi:hypothetical protein
MKVDFAYSFFLSHRATRLDGTFSLDCSAHQHIFGLFCDKIVHGYDEKNKDSFETNKNQSQNKNLDKKLKYSSGESRYLRQVVTNWCKTEG